MVDDPSGAIGRQQWTPLGAALGAAGDHWTLAIALELASGRTRLRQLHIRLPGISAGVLDRYIRHMVSLGLISRTRFREMPPRVELELTESGRELLPIARELARWGMRRMWPAAVHLAGTVDVNILLHRLPDLIAEDAELPDGTVEAVLEQAQRISRHVFRVENGRMVLADTEEGENNGEGIPAASARISGSAEAWIAALGPEHDCGDLAVSDGSVDLAERVLAGLPHPVDTLSDDGRRSVRLA